MSGRQAATESSCWRSILTVSVIVMAISSALCASVSAQSEEDLFSGVTTLIAPYSKSPPVSIDGVITAGEFDPSVTSTTSDTDISISLIHDNESLDVGITGPVWSWVAIGISSDNAATMGFVVVVKEGDAYEVEQRMVTAVAETMTFQPIGGPGAVRGFAYSIASGNATAELKLELAASFWALEPGVVYPTVVATNLTAPEGAPTGLSGSQVHFMASYLLRQDDSVKDINDLLNGKINPAPSLVAVGILLIGIVAIFIEFVVRRRVQ